MGIGISDLVGEKSVHSPFHILGDPDAEEAVGAIQDTIEGHATRSKSLSILRTSGGRIHIARPWLKKKGGAEAAAAAGGDSAGVTEESSGLFLY